MINTGRMTLAAFIAAMGMLLGACATGTPDELQKARVAYQQAEQSQADQYAPSDLQEARQALIAAERAEREGGDMERIRTLSYYALRQAQKAQSQARTNYLAEQRDQRQEELFAATEEARQRFRTRAERFETEAERRQAEVERERELRQMTSEQLEQQREELEALRDQIDERTEELEEEMGLTREEIQQREEELAEAVEQLEEEIERREQAEQQLAEAIEELEQVTDVEETEDGRIVNLDNSVLFEFGESDLRPDARQQLGDVAEILREQEQASIVVEGHTDAVGNPDFNEQLSRDRAQAVRDFLVNRGVNPQQVQTRGVGEDEPIASNESPEGRAMNRRVEILIQTPDEAIGGGPEDEGQQQQPDEEGEQQPDEGDEAIEQQPDEDVGGGPEDEGQQQQPDEGEQGADEELNEGQEGLEERDDDEDAMDEYQDDPLNREQDPMEPGEQEPGEQEPFMDPAVPPQWEDDPGTSPDEEQDPIEEDPGVEPAPNGESL